MCNAKPDKKQKPVELADIFNQYGESYCQSHQLSMEQHKVLNAVRNCRTKALGGHVLQCDQCGELSNAYNSCRNRHCPKCQILAQARWLQAREKELLPVEYFHVVFTIPHELNGLAGYNQALLYNTLFKAAWHAIDTSGRDEKWLGGQMGMQAFLHTWSQNLGQHIHLHCLIPGGALTQAGEWQPSKPDFLFPVKVLSKLFRGTFVSLLRKAFEKGEFQFKGSIGSLREPKAFTKLLDELMKKSWNVYAKKPFNGAKGGLSYLGRYVKRIAISNNRILSCADGKVRFRWRDYAHQNKKKIMTLDADEFIRRFLIHVLPRGFIKNRTFGFLANTCKKKKIKLIKTALNLPQSEPVEEKAESAAEIMLRLTGIDIELCSVCKKGKLRNIRDILSFKQDQEVKRQQTYYDTS